MCEQAFDTRKLINEHYQQDHSIVFVYEKFQFQNIEEFERWKVDVEEKSYFQFSTAMWWKTKSCTVTKYICHRSGEKRLRSVPRIIPKLIGSKKLGGICPTLLTMRELFSNGSCSVLYQKTHVGHECDIKELPHTNLNAKEKLTIANKLSLGVPLNVVLGQYESTQRIGEDTCSRLDLLNYHDVANIAKQYNVNEPFPALFKEDSKNIASFLIKNKNAILFYKAEGIEDEKFPTLKKDDFALGYMDHNQERTLKRYGYKTICFDGTHGTNPKDFILHTILVTDVDCEGYPVAFLLTNRNDEVVISVLLEKIKDRVGNVLPKTIMSDMQMSYFNSWVKNMGPVKHKLFCTWHVHEAWRKNLSKINNKEKRIAARKTLYDLSTELNEEEFKKKLYTFLSNNDEDLQTFLDYFFQYYGQNNQFWAYCYRQYAGCNTNMNLESFHRVLKEKIICRLKVKSVYNCLCYLEKYLTMKENDIQKKQIRTKRTNKLKILRINHKKIENHLESKCIVIKPINFNSWHVKSLTNENIYIVLKTEIKECIMYADEFSCSLPCTKCKKCFHDFICSCHDHCIRNNMCKHIHAVGMYILNNEQITLEDEKNMEMAHQDKEQIAMVYQNQGKKEQLKNPHLEGKRTGHQDNGKVKSVKQ